VTRWSSFSSSKRVGADAARAARCAAALILCLAGLALPGVAPAQGVAVTPACTRVDLFHREGCPHCARARRFLATLSAEFPALRVVQHDVVRDPGARRAFFERAGRIHGRPPGVPLMDVCGALVVGFDDARTTGALLRELVRDGPGGSPAPADDLELALFGTVSVRELGLPVFTVAVGLVDGFNPCAMWMLLFLLSILVNLRRRARILAVAGTFVLVSGLVYFAFMAAWLELFLVIGFSRALQIALGAMALLVAGINLKDFAVSGAGMTLAIPARAKPGIYARVRAVVQAENLAGAIAAVAVLALLVNMLELLCTAGLPALYTQVLSRQGLDAGGYYGYLALYNVAYVFDDAVMVTVVTWTLRRTRLAEGAGRWLKLVSAVAVGVLGLLLLLRPGWLY